MPRDPFLTKDFDRVESLPRRVLDPSEMERAAKGLTELIKVPSGTWALNPIQGQALYEMSEAGGLFGGLGVGSGKTLISLLAPYILESRKPLLLVPAALRVKTERDRNQLAKHFPVARHARIVSYEELGRVGAEKLLDTYQPDLIVADEVHRLKNRRAAVTRRVERYMVRNPATRFVALSGTVIKSSVSDFAHILRWCLKDQAPVPMTVEETSEWAQVLDTKEWPSVAPGKLDRTGHGSYEAARHGFRDRLLSTPGVLIKDSPEVNASLRIQGVTYDVNDKTETNFKNLRLDWAAPTGWTIAESARHWAMANQLALGLHYEYRVPAPEQWLACRRAWAQFVRKTLARSRTYDSELQVRNAVEARTLDDLDHTLRAWLEVQPTYEPVTVPVWHDDSALDLCAAWLEKPGIVFSGHAFFGRALAKRHGLRYYGEQGFTDDGLYIEAETGDRPIVASQNANGTGKNLQFYDRGLITFWKPGPDGTEQLLGRLHRQGQASDEVQFDVLFGCREHVTGFEGSLQGSDNNGALVGVSYRIQIADKVDIPDLDNLGPSYRWRAPS